MSLAAPPPPAGPPPAAWETATEWPDHLLGIGDLTCVALTELVELAARMKAAPAGWIEALRGESLICLFERPSPTALASAEAAAHRLGMLPIALGPDDLGEDAEAFGGTVRILSSYAAAVFARTFAERRLKEIARAAEAPVINAVSDDEHPCQALADLLALRERFGRLEGLTLAYVGPAAGGVAHSLMQAGALAAMRVRVASPPGLGPAREVEVAAQALADLHGGVVTVTEDPEEAVAGADAVYAGLWEPAGRDARDLGRYRVDTRLMGRAKPSAVFLHCRPARRGGEVSTAVIESGRSIVWQQAANGLPAEQAAIYALVSAGRAAQRP